MTFKDAADVIYIKPRPCAFLQSHGITQDDWQRFSFSPSFHRVGAKLLHTKQWSNKPQNNKFKSLRGRN